MAGEGFSRRETNQRPTGCGGDSQLGEGLSAQGEQEAEGEKLGTACLGMSLVIQGLRFCAPNAGGPGLIPVRKPRA